MAEKTYKYIIVGGGLAGASAVEEIRKRDKKGTILLVGKEKRLPYNRPPLTKDLWFGRKELENIYVQDEDFYEGKNIETLLGVEIVGLNPQSKEVTDKRGNVYGFEKLLLATGGLPRTLPIAGGDWDEIYYYRYMDDYLRLRQMAAPGKTAVVIGAGFIGSEMAAALKTNGFEVTLLFPSPYPANRILPEGLGRAMLELYSRHGVKLLAGDRAVSLAKERGGIIISTEKGAVLEANCVIVGVGVLPAVELAQAAGLEMADGVVVNEFLQTSHPDIYAAGDIAYFPHQVLKQSMRVEHWDNALNQGRRAGANMAGASKPYDHIPDFWSDLFEFSYQAVGQIDSKLETFADWEKENETGVIYYLKEGKVRGALMCNIMGKLDKGRELMKREGPVSTEELRGAIHS